VYKLIHIIGLIIFCRKLLTEFVYHLPYLISNKRFLHYFLF